VGKKGPRMKQCREFVVNVLVGGLLVVVPIYLAVLLLPIPSPKCAHLKGLLW
jgi:hypothetical protein